MTDATKTVQLRRYQIVEGELDAFLEWWQARLLPARQATGFTLEFAYSLPETNEFVWAVSVPGDRATFEQIETAYLTSAERTAAFDGVPQRTASQNVTLVDVIV